MTEPPADERLAPDEFNAKVREHIDMMDGSPESAVALLTGIPRGEIEEYER